MRGLVRKVYLLHSSIVFRAMMRMEWIRCADGCDKNCVGVKDMESRTDMMANTVLCSGGNCIGDPEAPREVGLAGKGGSDLRKMSAIQFQAFLFIKDVRLLE